MKSLHRSVCSGGRITGIMLSAFLFSCISQLQGAEAAGDASARTTVHESSRKENPPEYYKSADSRTAADYEVSETNADKLAAEAGAKYQTGEYEASVGCYLKAIEIFKKIAENFPQNTGVPKKLEACKEALSKAYFHWAEQLYFDACAKADAKDFDGAIANCQKASDMWPACREKMDVAIRRFTEQKKIAEASTAASDKVFETKNEERIYSLDVLQKQGDALFRDGQYDKAREKYEEILAQDPYNFRAIDSIRKANLKLLSAGKRRTNASRSEYVAEVDWKMISPGMARLLSMTDSKSSDEPVVKAKEESPVARKMQDIVLPSIKFEQAELPDVLEDLMNQSKEQDPDKVGVNIVFRNGNAEGASSQEQASDATANPDGMAGPGGPDAPGGPVPGQAVQGTASSQTISLDAENITLFNAIQQVCDRANLKYKIDDYAVVIATQDVPLENMERRIYVLDSKVFSADPSKDAIMSYFKDRGVNFSGRASAVYLPSSSRLIVNNTRTELKKVDGEVAKMINDDIQILIEAKFVEVQMNDAEELGFHYQVSRANENVLYTTTETGASVIQGGGFNTTGKYLNAYSPLSTNGYHPYIGTVEPGDYVPSGIITDYAPLQSKSTGWSPGIQSTANRTIRNLAGYESVTDGLFGFQHYNEYGYKVAGTITALDQTDSVDILLCPRITTVSGYSASIKMVDKKYYPDDWNEPEISSDSNNQMFVPSTPEFGDAEEEGISLNVKPEVDREDNRTIRMPLDPTIKTFTGWDDYSYKVQEENDIDANYPLEYTSTLKMPRFEVKSVNTIVHCYDGETIIVGGVIKDVAKVIDDQYPILGDLPLVGRFFQSKARASNKTNLLIFLTCRLIKPDGSPLRERVMRGLPPFRQ